MEAYDKVSIIVPVHNQWKLTFNCIKAIQLNTKNVPYEIIIVDDCSSDETEKMLSFSRDVIYLRNAENIGFIRSCNKGAKAASGQYLVFLNNDTEVQHEWLSELLATFQFDERTGIVGSKLVFTNGRLQEAGGIVWSDGSAWNYGRGESPDEWKYNYIREVDYVTGACICVKKELWDQCQGFDELYLPAYYEDTDLCFEARNRGYKVYYQPRSVVVHHEGATSGTNLTSGVKKYQVVNKNKFYKKWNDVLTKTHWYPDSDLKLRSKRHGRHPEILIVDHKVPEPDKDSGSVRMMHLISLFLQKGFGITFFSDSKPDKKYADRLMKKGVEVIEQFQDFEGFIKERFLQFDIVWLARPNVSFPKFDVVQKYIPKAKIVYDTVDLYFVRTQRQSELESSEELSLSAAVYREEELYLSRSADLTVVITEDERKTLAELAPEATPFVIPNIHELPLVKKVPFHARKGLMFLGGYQHPPNGDAVRWFIKEVLPFIREKLQDVVLFVLGSNPSDEILVLHKPGVVEVIGWVEDLEPWFSSTRVFVCPLRYGAGMKGKNGQSMSYGLPIVTTSIGAEGMQLIHGKHALIANSASEFAQSVIDLYESEDLWNHISTNSREHIKELYSPDQVSKSLDLMFKQLHTNIEDGDYIREDIKQLSTSLQLKSLVMNERKKWLLRSLKVETDRLVYIWGSGSGGMRTLQLLQEFGISIAGFVDSDRSKHGQLVKGLPVLSPDALTCLGEGKPFVIIGSMYRKEIESQLRTMGFDIQKDTWANHML